MGTLPKDSIAAEGRRPPRAGRVARSATTRAPRWHGWLLWLLMLSTLPIVNPHIRGDGNDYYAFVRSIVIDHDLQFDNEYARRDDTFKDSAQGELGAAAAGHRLNIGPSLLWTPFFLGAHAAVHVAQGRGASMPADGYSWPYLWACAGGTAFYAFLGLWLSYRMALRFAAPNAALLATIAVWLASSLPVYLYFLPFHVHAMAMFTVALFLWVWLRIRDGNDGRAQWFLWGLCGGLVVATYDLNGLVLVLVPLECLLRAFKPRQFVETLVRGLTFGLGAVLLILPMLVSKGLREGMLIATAHDSGRFLWRAPRLLSVAFSPEHGVFSWTPVLLLAAIGLLWLIRRTPLIASTLLFTAAAFYYVVASFSGWHGDSSYGNRFLVSLAPIFIMGFASMLDAFCGSHRSRWIAAWGLSLALIIWNAGFMLQWGTGIVPSRGPVDLAVVARNQVTVVPRAGWQFLNQYFHERKY